MHNKIKKIAILRSLDLKQAMPAICELPALGDMENVKLKLFYTDGYCTNHTFCSEKIKLPKKISCSEVVTRLLEWGADAVVSLSIPDNDALRDSVVKKMLEKFNVPMVMHSINTTL
jgi:hypothetical protein